MGFFDALKKKPLKVDDQQLILEAMICVAFADGDSQWEEIELVRAFANTLPEFKNADVYEVFEKAEKSVKLHGAMTRAKELKNIGSETLRIKAFMLAMDIALSSGEIDDGEEAVLATMAEAMNISSEKADAPVTGNMSFTETILFFDQKPDDAGIRETIIFYNDDEKYHYQRPQTLCDYRSAVLCFPNNFDHDDYDEGIIRVTFIANFDQWNELDRPTYIQMKKEVRDQALALTAKLFPKFQANLLYHDVFTPKTITRYTGHFQGAVYGTTQKARDGRTGIRNLFICGTDQGFLGIVGAMLSGISMANLHGLMNGESA